MLNLMSTLLLVLVATRTTASTELFAFAVSRPSHVCPSLLRIEHLLTPNDRTVLVVDHPQPRLSWALARSATAPPPVTPLYQGAYQVVLRSGAITVWDSGVVHSQTSVNIETPPLPATTAIHWTVSLWDDTTDGTEYPHLRPGAVSPCSASATFDTTVAFDNNKVHFVRNSNLVEPATECDMYTEHPNQVIVRRVSLDQPPSHVDSARLHVTALGYVVSFWDTQRVSPDRLEPAWTNPNATLHYATYNITQMLTESTQQQNHVLELELGNGFFNPLPLRFWGHLNIRDHLASVGLPAVACIFSVVYQDGSSQQIVSNADDGLWTARNGSRLFNNVYLGEKIELGRNTSTSAESSPVVRVDLPVTTRIHARPLEPTRIIESIPMAEVGVDTGVYDATRNMAGVVNATIYCHHAGDTFELLYGEILFANGSVNPLTSTAGQIKSGNGGPCAPQVAVQRDRIVCVHSNRTHHYVPEFTWHGFRYVHVNRSSSLSRVLSLCALPMSTQLRQTGFFTSDSERLNAIDQMALNTQRSNMMGGIQSDCPHRERFGYGGDMQATSEALSHSFHAAAFYLKRVDDYLSATGGVAGAFPETAPYVGISDAGLGGNAGPVGWAVAPIAMAVRLYRHYGETRVLRQIWEDLKAFVALLEVKAKDNLLLNGLGDWMSVDKTSTAMSGTGFYYWTLKMATEVATVLNETSSALSWSTRATQVRHTFNARFYNATSARYEDTAHGVSGTDCAQSMPLYLDMAQDTERSRIASAADAHTRVMNKGHFQGGMFSMRWWTLAMSDMGYTDTVVQSLLLDGFPSLGFMLGKGATTIWESWQWSDNEYSHNHPMFDSYSEFLRTRLAGIGRQLPHSRAFSHPLLEPHIPAMQLNITRASAQLETVRGLLSLAWHRRDTHTLAVDITVPPNANATLCLDACFSHCQLIGNGIFHFECTL